MPAFEDLAAREGVAVRETIYEVDAETFADAREKIDDGLTWAVGGVVSDDAGRVLLVREDGRWFAPGGEVETGETLEEALVREVAEETGVAITPDEPVAVTEVSYVHGDQHRSFHFVHFTATPQTTELTDDPGLDGEAIEEVQWAETVPEDTLDREVVLANR
ncbi:MAG: NUDIX domain-containing protein [Haloarculaceae archaeon]